MSQGSRLNWQGSRGRFWLIGFAILAIAGFRLAHIGADTPDSIWSDSFGEFVDEGDKTLDARNLFLFGQVHWNPNDDFRSWSKWSPVTQAAYYLGFLGFGPSLETARMVAILFFVVFLVSFAVGMRDCYSTRLTILGLCLLGFSHTLFLFSRMAMMVMPLITCLFAPLFMFRRFGSPSASVTVGLPLAFAVFATLGVKISASLYFLPILLAMLGRWLLEGRGRLSGPSVLLGAALAVLVTAFATWTWDIWWHRMQLSPVGYARRLFGSAMMEAAPATVASGLLCAVHLLATRTRKELTEPYRMSLLALALGGPALVGLFPYAPIRYYAPLLPAYPLLILDWIGLKAWRSPLRTGPGWILPISSTLLLIWTSAALLQASNRFVLGPLPFLDGATPGVTGPIRLRLLGLLAVGSGVALWHWRERILGLGMASKTVGTLTCLTLALDVYLDARFLLAPTYERRELSSAIREVVPPGSSVAGEWAPFLVLGSEIPALLMSLWINSPARVDLVRPDFVLIGENDEMKDVLPIIRGLPGVQVQEAVFRSSFRGREVRLHPVRYSP